jgi:hypothetical protein
MMCKTFRFQPLVQPDDDDANTIKVFIRPHYYRVRPAPWSRVIEGIAHSQLFTSKEAILRQQKSFESVQLGQHCTGLSSPDTVGQYSKVKKNMVQNS